MGAGGRVVTVRTAAATAARERRPQTLGRPLVPALGALGARILGLTLRWSVTGAEALEPLWGAGRPLIYVVWHGRIFMAPWTSAELRRSRGARRVTVLASRSRDGELVARWVARFGLATVRGSTSRGGASAVRALASVLRDGADIVVVPDGPRGPSGRMQPGAVALAALTGAPVVPLAIAARPALRLGTWDRFLVPLPFARAAIVLGAPIAIGREADRETARRDLEAALAAVTARADAVVGS